VLERSGRVDWKAHQDPAECVLLAQVNRLKHAGVAPAEAHARALRSVLSIDMRQTLMNELGERIRALPGAVS
jgi:hypothetical protein